MSELGIKNKFNFNAEMKNKELLHQFDIIPYKLQAPKCAHSHDK